MSGTTGSPLHGRALVTGGTAGIGLSFARALAARGLDLVLVARDAERLRTTAAELTAAHGVDVEVIAADLSDREQVERVAERLRSTEAPIEVLVNNAGSAMRQRIAQPDLSEHELALDLMVRTVLVLGGTAAYTMKERGHGVVINVGSVAGLIAMNHYSAIKAWVNTFSEAMALELSGTGVRVMTLVPGWVRTEFHERSGVGTSGIPDQLWLDADRLIADTLDAVDAGKDRLVPSKRFAVLGFLAEHLPRSVLRRASTRIQGKRA